MANFMEILYQKFYDFFVYPSGFSNYKSVDQYMFKWQHFVLIACFLTVMLLSYFLLRKKGYKAQHKFLVFISICIMICEIFTRVSKLIAYAELGWLTVEEAIKIILPIHFCAVMVWFIIISILTNNRAMMSFGALAGAIATVIYMCYPFEGINSISFNIRGLNSMLTHGFGFVGCSCMMLWGIAKFELKDMWKTFALLIAIVLYGLIMNFVFPKNNYMFMITNPTPLSFGKIPYQLVFGLLVSAIVASFYLIPYWFSKIKQRIKNRKSVLK